MSFFLLVEGLNSSGKVGIRTNWQIGVTLILNSITTIRAPQSQALSNYCNCPQLLLIRVLLVGRVVVGLQTTTKQIGNSLVMYSPIRTLQPTVGRHWVASYPSYSM
jgi:hypothetical protein